MVNMISFDFNFRNLVLRSYENSIKYCVMQVSPLEIPLLILDNRQTQLKMVNMISFDFNFRNLILRSDENSIKYCVLQVSPLKIPLLIKDFFFLT